MGLVCDREGGQHCGPHPRAISVVDGKIAWILRTLELVPIPVATWQLRTQGLRYVQDSVVPSAELLNHTQKAQNEANIPYTIS